MRSAIARERGKGESEREGEILFLPLAKIKQPAGSSISRMKTWRRRVAIVITRVIPGTTRDSDEDKKGREREGGGTARLPQFVVSHDESAANATRHYRTAKLKISVAQPNGGR